MRRSSSFFVAPSFLAALLGVALVPPGCAGNETPSVDKDPGSLVRATMAGQVGVLLDELPSAARDRVATALLSESQQFWEARARRQVDLTTYKLVFRNFYYDDKLQLPLPPPSQLGFTFGKAERKTVDGHDLVVMSYTLTGTLLAPEDEAAKADAALANVGGTVDEAFVLPIDPEHLLERTGYACMNEVDFPPNSVDTENARFFYDDSCEAGKSECHLTVLPSESCVDAVAAKIGGFETVVHFERLAWDSALADDARVGTQSQGGPQLEAAQEGVQDNRIVYRYYADDSCAITEGCVGAAGWRRLLMFTATVANKGDADMVIGDTGPDSLAVANHLVSPSECHGHMHFNHYGKFTFGSGSEELGSKRAFCLESTNRYYNNELSPLTHAYDRVNQGTARGWGDDYIAGLDCQWIDITPVDTTAKPVTAPLTFHYNFDKFLCEGQNILDSDGNPTFVDTTFKNEHGDTERAFACNERADAAADNVATVDVTVPQEGGLVTEPCDRFVVGDKRNCGMSRLGTTLACMPGAAVTVSCTGGSDEKPAAVRVCEASKILGGIPCLYNDALGNAQHTATAASLAVTCPSGRSSAEPGGSISVFVGPLVEGDDVSSVACTIN